jgi:hypothetical protein
MPNSTITRRPREFICRDCGIEVVQFVVLEPNLDDVCMTCLWLRDIADPNERDSLRKVLNRERSS